MDLIKAPQDIELRNIIDKLAEFVARNGPEFEQMTKNKQKGNPKFGFLFGGEHFGYYQYKVGAEQAILKHKDGREEHSVPSSGPPPNMAATTLSSMIMNAVQGITQQSGNSMGNISNLNNSTQAGLVAQWIVQHTQQQTAPLPLPTQATIESLAQQQNVLREQINQSEQNLNAQHLVLVHHEEQQIQAEIRKVELAKLQREADELGISLAEFDAMLQPIMDSCTKDSISNGKTWLLGRSVCKETNDLLARYLLFKVLDEPGKKFFRKLHVIYLVNDILHHCVRKHIEGFKVALDQVVVPMFVNASLGVTEEQQGKLTKLLLIWEKKNHYFPDEIVSQLKDPANSWERYTQRRLLDNGDVVDAIKASTKSAVSTFQSQHLAFVAHARQQIQVLDQQRLALIDQQQKSRVNSGPSMEPKLTLTCPPPTLFCPDGGKDDFNEMVDLAESNSRRDHLVNSPRHEPIRPSIENRLSRDRAFDNDHDDSSLLDIREPPRCYLSPPGHRDDHNYDNPSEHRGHNNIDPRYITGQGGSVRPDPRFEPRYEVRSETAALLPPPSLPPIELPININQPPPGYGAPPPPAAPSADIQLPDLTRPPPGFPPVVVESPFLPEDLLPSLPYFDLPAGLMVPLIRLEDYNYKPLDPEAIRLPPPAPPSERLLAAVKAFYMPPRHENPRDSDGWEKLGLYEYFRAKAAAKKQKEMELEEGLRSKSESPTLVRSWQDQAKSPPPKRRYSSRSRSKSRERETVRSKRRRRDRSRSAEGRGERRDSRSDRDRPERERDRDDRDRDDSREAKSPTPPSFMGVGSFTNAGSEDRLGETNKGHQLLKKMGWGGAGLGAKEQGIEQPISGGDVRDRQDQYKGVGINLNDPYENFRKSKGQAFINRMKARAEERTT